MLWFLSFVVYLLLSPYVGCYLVNVNLVLYVSQKEGEKAVDELRKYYSAQAAKHKENMEQAVSHKVLITWFLHMQIHKTI